MVEKVEAMESGMTMPNRSSTIDEDAPSDSKRSRKMSPSPKSMPSGSVADEMPKPTSRLEPKQPDGEPPIHLQTKEKHQDRNKITVKDDDNDQWMQAKIAEAATEDSEATAGDSGGRQYGGEGANQFNFEPSWQMAIQQYGVDSAAQMQLALLRDRSWYAAADVVWKLTKKGDYDDELRNPGGFVNRCCTTAHKNLQQW